jgi:serine/threonine protein kinase
MLTNNKCFARKIIRVFVGVSEKEIKNEIRAVNKLCKSSHPNIVQVLDFGKIKNDGALYFIDMELCSFTLESYIQGREVPFIESWEAAFRRATEEDQRNSTTSGVKFWKVSFSFMT